MKFMLILAEAPEASLWPGDPGFEELVAEYRSFHRLVGEQGILVAAGRLRPKKSAVTVRVRDGKVLRTDGPFAETKEAFGGYFLLECRDQEHALELAAQVPAARHGGAVEVRPLVE